MVKPARVTEFYRASRPGYRRAPGRFRVLILACVTTVHELSWTLGGSVRNAVVDYRGVRRRHLPGSNSIRALRRASIAGVGIYGILGHLDQPADPCDWGADGTGSDTGEHSGSECAGQAPDGAGGRNAGTGGSAGAVACAASTPLTDENL
jgi:hypothetical protein